MSKAANEVNVVVPQQNVPSAMPSALAHIRSKCASEAIDQIAAECGKMLTSRYGEPATAASHEFWRTMALLVRSGSEVRVKLRSGADGKTTSISPAEAIMSVLAE